MRMRFPIFVTHIFFISLMAMTGCMNTAIREITMDDIEKLKPGETRKEDMIAYYGEPWNTIVENNLTGLCFVNMGMKNKILFLQFDQQGILVYKHFNTPRAEDICGLSSHTHNRAAGTGGGGGHAGHKSCSIDIECGVGAKCVSGVCTGGIGPQINGRCVEGNFGKKVCTNNGRSCMNDSQCL